MSGPEFAMLSMPLPEWVKFGLKWSLNDPPQAESPPEKVQVILKQVQCIKFNNFVTELFHLYSNILD